MIQNITLRLFSNDAKKLANFYNEVLGCGNLRMLNGIKEAVYLCNLSPNLTLEFRNVSEKMQNSTCEMKLQVSSVKQIEKKLKEWNVEIVSNDEDFLSFKDFEGNMLYIEERKRLKYVGMPVGG